MKLWQYGIVIMLMIGSFTAGGYAGYGYGFDCMFALEEYAKGHEEGYNVGYRWGVFNECWNAAKQHNATNQSLYNDSFRQVDGGWIATKPAGNYTYVLYHDGTWWEMIDKYPTEGA